MERLFTQKFTRKDFLRRSWQLSLGLSLSSYMLDSLFKESALALKDSPYLYEARFYKKIDEKTIQCELCPNRCRLVDGHRGFCRVREPKGGKLYSLVYGKACAVHIDPIEKKPLFHFLPGTPIFSIATAGCNFRCKFCQNWQISQSPPDETYNYDLSPQEIVDQTLKNNCPSIAYTYTEPSIFYEYMFDTAKLAKIKGIKNMYHSNGSLNPKPVEEISLYLDGANIDLKAFTQEFYSEICAGYLETVLETLRILKRNRVWVEITNLVVPTLNDDPNKIKQMCIWIKENLGQDVPIHFSRFWPHYKLTTLSPTPVETLEKARGIAQDTGLNFVYIGNVPGHPAENTYCPGCKKPVILRRGFTVLENNLTFGGNCKFCKYSIPGIWS